MPGIDSRNDGTPFVEPFSMQSMGIQPLWDAWDRSRLPTIIHDERNLPSCHLLIKLANLARMQTGHALWIHWLQPKGISQVITRIMVQKTIQQFDELRGDKDLAIDFVPWFGAHSFARVGVTDPSWKPHLMIQSRRDLLQPWMLSIGLTLRAAA